MKNLSLDNIDSILVIRLSSLGDILLSTPLIRAIKNNYPKSSIDMVVKQQYLDTIINNPNLRNKFVYNPENKQEFLNEIKTKKYNLVIDLQTNRHSKKILAAAGGIQVKFNKKSFKKFLLVNTKINLLKNSLPIPDRYAETVPGIRLDETGIDLYTEIPASKALENKSNIIGICPGGRHFTKLWPKDYYVKLSRLLIKDGWIVAMFGGLTDRRICLDLKSEVHEIINLQNDDNLLQTAADMKACKAIYCNDSGLMHTASAMHVPVIVFFGSTVKEFGFTPYKNKHLILENHTLSCRPCSHIGRHKCPKKHFKCMIDLNPQQAYDTLKKVLIL